MVQDQLVEYITSQTKAGISAETIKATLVAAGWQSADVDDTLKRVQSASSSGSPMVAAPQTISTAKAEPQAVVRVSDLISATSSSSANSMSASSASAAKAADARAEAAKKFLTPNVAPGATSYQAPASRATVSPSSQSPAHSRGPITVEILLGILMVAFGALAAYFLFANRGLAAQVATLTSESAGVTTQVSALQNQLDASTTVLTAELASTTMDNEELALSLSFYAVPPGSATTTTSTTMLVGTVSGGGKYSYVITTPYGARVLVANSKDPKVATLMLPLVGTTAVPFGGTYTPGVDNITLTTVNGVSLIAPPAVSTSTASSTALPPTAETSTAAAPMIPAPTGSTP